MRTPVAALIAVVAIILLAAFQAALLRAPADLADPVALGDGVHAWGYEIDAEDSAAVDLTLHLDGEREAHRVGPITLVRATLEPAADIRRPRRVALASGGDDTLKIRILPKVPPGAWKLRVKNGAPFGLVDVPR